MLTALTLFGFLLAAISLGLLGVFSIDSLLDLCLPGEDLVVGIDLPLERRDVRVQILVRLLEVLCVLAMKRRRIEVGGLVDRVRSDDFVVQLACSVVVFLSTKRDGETELARDVSGFG